MKLACYSCLSKDIPAIILVIYILSEMLKVLLSFWIMRCFGAVFQSRELFLLYSEFQLFLLLQNGIK